MTVRSSEFAVDLLDALDVEAYVLFVHDEERPLWGLGGLLDWTLAGGLSRMLEADQLGTADAERTLACPEGARVMVVGLGRGALDALRFEARARDAAAAVGKAGWSRIAVGVPERFPSEQAATVLANAFAALAAEVVIVTAAGHVTAPADAPGPAADRPASGTSEAPGSGKPRKAGRRR